MKMSTIRYCLTSLLVLIMIMLHVQLNTSLSLAEQWELLTRSITPTSFAENQFFYANLPRMVMAVLVGGGLGLIGSLLQQLTQNRLLSPTTLGASSGAWLALILLSIFAPSLMNDYASFFALLGACVASGLVLLIAGRHGLSGISIVLGGMAVHTLLVSIAVVAIVLNQQFVKHIFLWGAGDLTQTSWMWVSWLWPKMGILAVLLLIAPRPLMVLRLGQEAARARGLSWTPILLGLSLLALFVLANMITAVGIIGFLGLLAPNFARLLGARRAFDELLYSFILGALLLLITDAIALMVSNVTIEIIPTGTAAALIGLPCFIGFALQHKKNLDDRWEVLSGRQKIAVKTWCNVLLICIGFVGLSLCISFDYLHQFRLETLFQWPSSFTFSVRGPRIVAAFAAGMGMACAGVLLQRLIRNPLASPDMLGLSSGATLALVAATAFTGLAISEIGPLVAFLGSLVVLGLLLFLGRLSQYSPHLIILIGFSLAAMVDAVVQFVLASGGDDVYSILTWLGGSTYQISGMASLGLLSGVGLFVMIAMTLSRWLTLLSVGDSVAGARGLNIHVARLILLSLAALLTAFVTSFIGPIAFVGLLAPHMASLLGASKPYQQLLLASLIGTALMLFSDVMGQTLVFPAQLPAGMICSIFGGGYFVYLLGKRMRQ